jgi:signal transduction histidine kinase
MSAGQPAPPVRSPGTPRAADDVEPAHVLSAQLIHDLRTPLGQIISYTEMLMERATAGGHGDYVPDLEKVHAAGYRLMALLDDRFRTAPGAPAPADGGHGHPASPPAAPRLADFIQENREEILAEWEAFARTCTPASADMDMAALRDHANEMLTVFAKDLRTPQGDAAQSAKARGRAPRGSGAPTAAEEHGAGRAESGFTVEQMVSEYRALRASVIRLWMRGRGEGAPTDMEDLTRFSEAIDQALAESIWRYTDEMDTSREMFLAILGHDLRAPLGSIFTSARFMLDTGDLEEPHRTLTRRIASSSTRMVDLVGALLDFTRSRLGGGIPVTRAAMDMGTVVHDVVDELAASHPARTIRVDARGEMRGEWDSGRIHQVLANLVGNALEHGSAREPVTVEVKGDPDEVCIAVGNRGSVIPAHRLAGIFNPMKPRDPAEPAPTGGRMGNLGLGLYIADRIVAAHRGRINVRSSEGDGTVVTVHLPRRA